MIWHTPLFTDFPCVLIETYWNVNTTFSSIIFISSLVLIETYWNVNYGYDILKTRTGRVLIETYWNVNI